MSLFAVSTKPTLSPPPPNSTSPKLKLPTKSTTLTSRKTKLKLPRKPLPLNCLLKLKRKKSSLLNALLTKKLLTLNCCPSLKRPLPWRLTWTLASLWTKVKLLTWWNSKESFSFVFVGNSFLWCCRWQVVDFYADVNKIHFLIIFILFWTFSHVEKQQQLFHPKTSCSYQKNQ